MLHQHYRDQVKAALHTCSFQSRWHPQTSRQRCSSASSPKPDNFGTSRIQLWPTYRPAPSSLTKCFTLTDRSEGIRDPTGVVESGKTMPPRAFQYLLLKWQILPDRTKHMNCVQTATLGYNRTMRWQRKNSISPYHATKLCFYFNTQFPVGTLRVMLFQKLHTTAVANDNPCQETGKQSLKDGVFFLIVNITQKKSIPDLQEESVELCNPKFSL